MKGYDHGILKSPLKLIGAKTKIRPFLYKFFPKQYDVYIEPFMGTAGVLIGNDNYQKDDGVRFRFELTSDTNQYAINFFKVLQDSPERFWELYEAELPFLLLNGKSRFERIRDNLTTYDDPLLQAVWFYLLTKTCMNGIFRVNKDGKCNSSYCGTTKGRGFMDRQWFDSVRQRIRHVTFCCEDYSSLLGTAQYESRNPRYEANHLEVSLCSARQVFVFLDPPYSRCKTTYNGQYWGDDKFIELHQKLTGASYKWLLTINDNEFIRDLFKGYDMVEHKVFYSCSQTAAGRGAKDELLIANYPISSIMEGIVN